MAGNLLNITTGELELRLRLQLQLETDCAREDVGLTDWTPSACQQSHSLDASRQQRCDATI